jgi:hypothetical protein
MKNFLLSIIAATALSTAALAGLATAGEREHSMSLADPNYVPAEFINASSSNNITSKFSTNALDNSVLIERENHRLDEKH